MNDSAHSQETEFRRGLGLFDSIMIVTGIMIGSGIFIVSAEMSRQIGSGGWLLVAWTVTGVLTVFGALSYGELAAMMPQAGGMYVYLREAFSPLMGFLYGWTLWTVIQTGTIAAVAIAFARFTAVLAPSISESHYLIAPIHISSHYALSLSTAQVLAIVIIVALTVTNSCGLKYGKWVQNIFTVAKIGALLALIAIGLTFGANAAAIHANFHHFWTAHPTESLATGFTSVTAIGMFVAICVSQTGSLFAADAWHEVAFLAAEVRNPRRNLPLALMIGTVSVIVLYLLANVGYLLTLPLPAIQHVADDRVATAVVSVVFPKFGAGMMAVAIVISTLGTTNALTLAGARASFAMAEDGLFFPVAKRLNKAHVPGWALLLQGAWSVLLVIPRTFNPATGQYGNLYSDLLAYVISAALLFYIFTVAGVFRLRRTRPDAHRPYRTWGYPLVPAAYIVGAAVILVVLFVYQPTTTWPGLLIVALGVPVYFAIRARRSTPTASGKGQQAGFKS
ncbi:MAG TPA: amino acid permease [Terracidiphilus sp.]|nr:amino acid permease [Terracidiphilus sp.]